MHAARTGSVLRRGGLAALAVAALAAGAAVAGAGEPAPSPRGGARASVPPVEAELVAEQTSVAPGGSIRVGVRLAMAPGWHVYWRTPGDSGLAPSLAWTLPPGVTVSPIAWPVPHRLVTPPLATYVYEDDVLLPVTVHVPAGFGAPTLPLVVTATWLVCEDECQPGEATLHLTVPVRDRPASVDLRTSRWFVAADAVPAVALPAPATAASLGDDRVALTLPPGGPWADPRTTASLFLDDALPFALVHEQPWLRRPDAPTLVLPRSATPGAPAPQRVRGLLVGTHPTSGPFRVEVDVPVVGRAALDAPVPARRVWPSDGDDAPPPPAAPTGGAAPPGSASAASGPAESGPAGSGAGSLPYLLLLAFLGGLILNVMPCVLPVLSVKALGFVEQAGERPGHVRAHGLVFAAGVVAAFWALVGVALALRGAGHAVGWGFQFQEPAFVGGFALVMLAMALNLFGVFELGTGVAAAAGQAETGLRRGTWLGSFASGVLATVVATPCAAPFMGTAVGYAMTAPAVDAFAVFTALGLGMAAPFVALLWFPSLLARVPRAGPWMETFRHVVGFPLLATVVWLGWVFGRLVGVSGLTRLLFGCIALGLALWAVGRFGGGHVGRVRRAVLGRALPLVAAAGAVGLMLTGARMDPAAEHAPEPGWVAWTPTVVEAQRAAGKPVFVDFTADWCLTCKVNEATVLRSARVEAAFARLGYVRVVGDFTRQQPDLLRALEAHGRDTVPLYVVWPVDRAAPPIVLPSAITPAIVVEALERGAPPGSVPPE